MTIKRDSRLGARPTGRGIGVLGAVLVGVLAGAGWGLHARADLYQADHGDIDIGYDALPVGEWELGFHLEGAVVDGVPDVEGEFEAGDLVVLVPASTQSVRPGGSAWDPIGAPAGEAFWFLAQSGTLADALGAPFLGIGAEEIGAGEFVGDQVSLTLVGVTGPGHFSMWQDGLAPTFLMSTADGVDAGDVFTIATGSHGHVNYGFTAPGAYQVILQASGVHVADGAVASNPTAFAVHVIPEPGSLGLAVAGIGLLALTRKRPRRLAHKENTMHKRTGFTLIELLVVIAVIAVLAALLVPAVQRGLMAARRTACASNMRQIGIGLTMYCNDHHGWFPRTMHGTSRDDREQTWIFTLAPYLDDVDDIRLSPGDPRYRERRENHGTSYVMNEYIAVAIRGFHGVVQDYTNRDNLDRPSATYTAFIGADRLDPDITADHTHSRNWGAGWDAVLADIQPDRHRVGDPSERRLDGSANYLFADAHVESRSGTDMYARWLENGDFARPSP